MTTREKELTAEVRSLRNQLSILRKRLGLSPLVRTIVVGEWWGDRQVIEVRSRGRVLVRCKNGHDVRVDAHLVRQDQGRPCGFCPGARRVVLPPKPTKDLSVVGTKWGHWTVVGPAVGLGWIARCVCGTERRTTMAALRAGRPKQCRACADKERVAQAMGSLLSKRFGSWLVLNYAGKAGKGRDLYWTCRCDCGTEAVVAGATLRNKTSTKCLRCAHRSLVEIAKEGLVGFGRLTDMPDEFGPKKRGIQRAFWSAVGPGAAFIFVKTDPGEWRIMNELGFEARRCIVLSDRPGKTKVFSRRCALARLPVPRIRCGTNLCGVTRRRPVVSWLRQQLGEPVQSAHLDFCGALKASTPALRTFLEGGLLAQDGILAVTVSYRGEDWLAVWEELAVLLAPYGLEPWLQRSPYTDTGNPMLFATFQRKSQVV